jgi:hypothetical protein
VYLKILLERAGLLERCRLKPNCHTQFASWLQAAEIRDSQGTVNLYGQGLIRRLRVGAKNASFDLGFERMTEKVRFAASACMFVAALLTSAALIFILGAFGFRGNSVITGGYLLITVVSTFLLGQQKNEGFAVTPTDSAFVVLAASVAIASLLHFDKSDYKEYLLLTVDSLFAYIAGRSLSISVLNSIRIRLLQISTPLVAAACVATIPNLIGNIYARPFVFGFFHAATVFCIAFGYMVIAYIFSDTEWRSKASLFLFSLIAVATAVFVASTIRFVLLAILLTALFSLACSIYRSLDIREKVILVIVAMIFGTIVGTFSRYTFVAQMADQLVSTDEFSGIITPGQNVVRLERRTKQASVGLERQTQRSSIETEIPPSCNALLHLNNSIEIRRALLRDALFFLPKAGFFGFGLDSFSKMSCFEGYQVHNSVLQAIIEFGWIAGIALIVLVAMPLKQFLLNGIEFDVNLQFLLSCICFATLLSLAYGQFSRELSLFLFLGAFAKASSRRVNASSEGRQASIPAPA